MWFVIGHYKGISILASETHVLALQVLAKGRVFVIFFKYLIRNRHTFDVIVRVSQWTVMTDRYFLFVTRKLSYIVRKYGLLCVYRMCMWGGDEHRTQLTYAVFEVVNGKYTRPSAPDRRV